MNVNPHQPDHDLHRLSPADAELLDRLLAGEPVHDPAQPEREATVRRLLGLIARWQAEDPASGLANRTVADVLCADPVALHPDDAEALDARLALRQRGMATGPMPAGTGERAARVGEILNLLDRSVAEPVPEGLGDRTMQAVQRDREAQRRRSMMINPPAGQLRPGGINIRQIATTAALLLMVLSVLLPMLDKGRRDAMVAQCGENLAGLGMDLQQFAFSNKGSTAAETEQPDPAIFNHLSEFARSSVDGTAVPASNVNLFVLLKKQQVDSDHLRCPAADQDAPDALYNGQNPIAGGPLRVFLKPRPIFADTNPLYRQTYQGLVRDPAIPGMTQSRNHQGIGQNVLISDGSVQWLHRPTVSRSTSESDNIWLYQSPGVQSGQAADEPDVFLTP